MNTNNAQKNTEVNEIGHCLLLPLKVGKTPKKSPKSGGGGFFWVGRVCFVTR
jgi:hypothetical protein